MSQCKGENIVIAIKECKDEVWVELCKGEKNAPHKDSSEKVFWPLPLIHKKLVQGHCRCILFEPNMTKLGNRKCAIWLNQLFLLATWFNQIENCADDQETGGLTPMPDPHKLNQMDRWMNRLLS